MADETENPETTQPTSPAGTGEATEADAAAPDAAPEAAAEPQAPLAPKERRAQRRAAAVAKRGARRASTPEERAEERKRKAAERRRYRARLKERRANRPKAEPTTADEVEKTGHKAVRQGIVVSDKADKTITVRLEVVRRHRRYHKTIRTTQTLHAHDERNEAHVGDTVRVVESRPLSRTKRWRLVEILERAR